MLVLFNHGATSGAMGSFFHGDIHGDLEVATKGGVIRR